MARPTNESTLYARSLGLKSRQLHSLGGMDRLKLMPEPQRNLLVGLAKQTSLDRLLREVRTRT